MGDGVMDYFIKEGKKCDAIGLVETKLRGERLDRAKKKTNNSDIKTEWVEAVATGESDRHNSGGVVVGAPSTRT